MLSKRIRSLLSLIFFGDTSIISLDIIEPLQTSLINIHALFNASLVMFGSIPLSNLYDASVLRS